jgi:hypothetical protein
MNTNDAEMYAFVLIINCLYKFSDGKNAHQYNGINKIL